MHLVLLPEVLWVDPLVQLLVDLLEVLLYVAKTHKHVTG
jgi:hypothetical protein